MTLDIWLSLAAIVVLITFSAFFSAAETALTGASKARLYALEQKGERKAALVNRIRDDKERMIGALLLGNNLLNILASAVATNMLITLFGHAGVLYATAIMTTFILIFAEVMPKTYALYHADTLSMAMAPLTRIIVVLFSPISRAVAAIVRFTLKLFGTDISVVAQGDNTEELLGAIDMHKTEDADEEGVIEQRAMLRSILDLSNVWVGEIMTHRRNMQTIDLGLPVDEIIQQVLESQYTRIPVWKEAPDNIVGIIHAKALLRELRHAGGDFNSVNMEQLALEPWFIPDTTTLYDQLHAFRERKEHFALVVDEYGTMMGMLTLEDILEEIVGDINDEHDISVAGVRKQPNGSYMVDGTVTIRDLNRELHWNLPDQHYSTLAGLVLYEARKIPEPGQVFNFHGFRFDIVRRQRNQITLVRVMPPSEKDDAAE